MNPRPPPGNYFATGGAGGGGRGNVGNAGGTGGAGGAGGTGGSGGSGGISNFLTCNTVPVIPGGSCPVVVSSPGGQVIICWNAQ